MLISLVILALTLGTFSPLSSREPRVLSFAQRVNAREAIARVQYSHQQGATQPFDQAVPRWVLERQVRDTLAQSVVLEDLWGVRVTNKMLQAESDRMARTTRLPDRLSELHAALGDDSVLILETLVRPALVSRLFHERFDADPAIQAGPWREAQALSAALSRGKLNPSKAHPRRRAYAATAATPSSGEFDPHVTTKQHIVMTKAEVVEETGAFVVRAPFERGGHALMAEYAVPRIAWEDWWRANGRRFDVDRALAVVANATGPLQSAPETAFALGEICQPGDNWAESILSQPGPVQGAYQAVWTGNVYLVIAGATAMAQYDPTLDSWLPMSTSGAPVGFLPTAVWTGSELVLYGGSITGLVPVQLGGRYDPITDHWVAFGFSFISRSSHTAVWTGSRMIVWGGRCEPFNQSICESTPPYIGFPRYFGDGFSYDPATNLSTYIPPVLIGRSGHTAVWTGSQMIIWGGFYSYRLGPGPEGRGWETINGGGIYDPATGLWIQLPPSVAQDRTGHTALWDGGRMFVVGGFSTRRFFDPLFNIIERNETRNSLARFDPVTGIWEALGEMPAYAVGDRSVWTGHSILTWGNGATGGRYDPSSALWSPITTVGAPAPRAAAAVAWDGFGMMVHGGRSAVGSLSDGGRYFPDLIITEDADADGFTTCGEDCDDENPAVNPSAAELCNGLDDDCDGSPDEGNPGGGAPCGASDVGACSLGMTACENAAIVCVGEVGPHPEICNGLDDDCDGVLPSNESEDADQDGYPVCADCDDGNPAVHPMATEICNGLDDDCDGALPPAESDSDQDGYRACVDCDDANPLAHPGATDMPGNLADEDCDGAAVCSPVLPWPNSGELATCIVQACRRLVADGKTTSSQCLEILGPVLRSKQGEQVGLAE